MKTTWTLLTILLVSRAGLGQGEKVASRQLSREEISATFTRDLKAKLEIDHSVHKAYEYTDKAGKHLIVMTQNSIDCKVGKDCYDAIKAFCYAHNGGTYDLEWRMRDFILPKGNGASKEYSISFWTEYLKLNDYDGDGFVEPIIVYGTFGLNQRSDGRIKILTYHLGKKRAIRHQNGVYDSDRSTQVDEKYYRLPKKIQTGVRKIMEEITAKEHGIFPSNWQEAMANEQLKFKNG